MEKKTLLALILIFVVYWLSNQFLWKQKPVEKASVSATKEETAPVKAIAAPVVILPDTLLSAKVEVKDNLILENDHLQVVFSNLGGVIKQVTLKDFKSYAAGANEENVRLLPANSQIMDITVSTKTEIKNFDSTVYNYTLTDTSIVFYLSAGKKQIVSKSFSLADDYSLNFTLGLDSLGVITGYDLAVASGMRDTETFLKDRLVDYKVSAQVNTGEKYGLEKADLRTLAKKKELVFNGALDWASVKTKYFTMGLIPQSSVNVKALKAYISNDAPAMRLSVKDDNGSGYILDRYKLYLGPVDYHILRSYGGGFENTAELGSKWIRPISRVFLWFFSYLHKFVPNYGVAVLIFALVLKIALTPFTHKTFKSSHKMQKIQPLMREIQKKYKDDPRQLQLEMGKLYKEHGVNPLGGCLPLLLQMPVFFALYPVLRYSFELRHAGFITVYNNWLTDLSVPDPYYILPVLMAIFMLVSSKMMMPKDQDTSTMDDQQKAAMQSQKMMTYIMPVFMFFIFMSLPAGLVLYWLFFNVLSTIQQFYVKKKHA